MFKKAERKKSKLRLAICAPSGAGKTYSALKIAEGLGGKIAMIDTENGSGELYSHLCDYDVAQIKPPFRPEKYVQAIKAAEQAGYDTVIIDSLSHAWAGEGGLLEEVDKKAKASKSGNSYTAWRDVTPMHNQLVNAMLQSSCHIIGTMRSKTAYEMQQGKNGKMSPVKIGLAPVQREGMDYEFTVVFDLSVDGHFATTSKDRTSLFDGETFVPSCETGEKLTQWLDGGAGYDMGDIRKNMAASQSKKDLDAYVKSLAVPEGHSQRNSIGMMYKEYDVFLSNSQLTAIQAQYNGVSRDERLGHISKILGRDVGSVSNITKDEAVKLLNQINNEVSIAE